MTTLRNHTKERLEAGRLALGLGLRNARTVDTGRALATCGYDWAFIDMEHNAMGIDTAVQMAVACQDAGVTPIMRVPGYEHYLSTRLLDAGAMGIVFPHVDTAEQAAGLVEFCKYPPQGRRSVGGAMAQLNFRPTPLAEASAAVNDNLLIVMMLESPQAIDNAEAIAAVPGVDVLLVGCNDLCMEMGIPAQFDSPRLAESIGSTVAACRAHGKHPGYGGVYDEAVTGSFVEAGMRFILAGGDLAMMMKAATARVDFLRGLEPG